LFQFTKSAWRRPACEAGSCPTTKIKFASAHEGDVEQRDESQNESNDARPGVALRQSHPAMNRCETLTSMRIVATANEKATRQQGDLLFSRENSSNGGLNSVKTFWTKSYGPKKGGVKQFLGNKCLWFQ
jgi:hypothetical protein